MNYERANRIRQGLGLEPLDASSTGTVRKDSGQAYTLPTKLQPGSIFAMVINKITRKSAATCGKCGQRMRQMNQWGWWNCWINRTTIVTWLVDEAKKRGHDITDHEVLSLFKAAFREMRQNKSESSV